jgi:hypothetical protein
MFAGSTILYGATGPLARVSRVIPGLEVPGCVVEDQGGVEAPLVRELQGACSCE